MARRRSRDRGHRALRDLADRAGIIAEYIDQTGRERRATKDRTRVALLAAMGYDVSTDEAVARSLASLRAEEEGRVLAPIRVTTDAGDPIRCRLPRGWSSRAEWELEITDERGRVTREAGRSGIRPRHRIEIRPRHTPGLGYHTLRLTVEARGAVAEGRQRLVVVPPRFIDPQGRIYWDTPIIEMQPAVKRSMKARLVRWLPGSDAPEVALEFADHGEFEHHYRYRPMPQTDAWVVDATGRIGILSAAEYRLRWYKEGALVETGKPVVYTPTRLTSAERDAFRARKALEPVGGATSLGGSPAARPVMDAARVRAAWPDSIFPEVMPPFETNGALLAPNGDIWVRRTGPASQPSARVDILDPHGNRRATLRLPARARLFALGARFVYLLSVDADGFQTLERYDYPGLR